MSHGQLQLFNDSDIGTLNRLYMMKPEKMRYFSQNIEQIASELKLLPPAIFNLHVTDTGRKEVFLQGYANDILTDAMVETIVILTGMNFKNLQYFGMVDCQLDIKRARSLNLIFSDGLSRLRHINLSKNPLREKGIHSVL